MADLEARLEDGRTWVCGGDYTLADVFWSVSLFRLAWLGMGFAWEGGHPLQPAVRGRVQAYADRVFRRPRFREAVVAWPLTPTSPFVARYLD